MANKASVAPPMISTIADLRKVGLITSIEIVAAIDRYLLDPATVPYQFASGHSIDVAAAIAASPEAFAQKDRPGPQEKALRNAITAIVMAAPVMPPRSRQ